MNNFLKPSATDATTRGAWISGVSDASVHAIAKCISPSKMQKMDGHDSISRGSPLVVERIGGPSVDAIRMIHQAGARPLTGDDVTSTKVERSVDDEAIYRLRAGATTLRKAINAPAVRDLPQSSNAVWTESNPSRVGAVGNINGYRDEMFGGKPTRVGSQVTESVSVPPQDDDADKRKPRRGQVDVQGDADTPLQVEPDADEQLDACTRMIRAEHRKGAKPDFPRR